MNEFIIFCDGGLGNRLGCLVGGIAYAEHIDIDPVICWPENSWCGCSFDDLFDSDIDVISCGVNELFRSKINYHFLIHENQTQLRLIRTSKPSLENLNKIKDIKSGIIYYNNTIPKEVDDEKVIEILDKFNVQDYIINTVDAFCNEHSINSSTIGVHLRKTDADQHIDENELYNKILNSSEKYFICSDDKDTELKYKPLTNVSTFKKKSYVNKLIDGEWNSNIVDSDGRKFPFNVKRSKESVIEGYIDMLILSKTKLLFETRSSFLAFAKKYKHINIRKD